MGAVFRRDRFRPLLLLLREQPGEVLPRNVRGGGAGLRLPRAEILSYLVLERGRVLTCHKDNDDASDINTALPRTGAKTVSVSVTVSLSGTVPVSLSVTVTVTVSVDPLVMLNNFCFHV